MRDVLVVGSERTDGRGRAGHMSMAAVAAAVCGIAVSIFHRLGCLGGVLDDAGRLHLP